MTELKKLEFYLRLKHINFTRFDREGDWPVHQIIVYGENKKRKWDAICQKGSYGYEKGLLEIYGDIVDPKVDKDTAVGWLKADDVIERIEKCS